jgi:ABC-2 type transport system ATP-binding protein
VHLTNVMSDRWRSDTDRIVSGCGTVVAMPMNPSGGPAGIALTGLTKSFRTGQGVVHAVRGVDIAIAPGETVALLGPNGAGKSTTIDMLLGLTAPDSGGVAVFGMMPRQAVQAGAVGAMLQVGSVIRDLSVRELVTMMASLYPNPLPVDEVLELTGTAAYASRRTQKLSGGQMQRVRFAVALVSNPDLLVLDEPTVAMDVEGRHAFWTTMRGFAATGKTVLFATHYLEEADEYADRIILMARGRVVADGPASEIKATVGSRTIQATLPGADPATLAGLPGVSGVDTRGDMVVLRCADSDIALRALLSGYPQACDIEVTGARLEQAFLQLTSDEVADPSSAESVR